MIQTPRLAGYLLCLLVLSPLADLGANEPLKFELDIQPILTARGCNSGPCHGKARGQNGFALSLLAFDADFDYQSIVTDAAAAACFRPHRTRACCCKKLRPRCLTEAE